MKRINLSNYLKLVLLFAFLGNFTTVKADDKLQPKWWFGGAVGANFNFYSGEIKTLNNSLPPLSAPFKKGSGAGLFIAPLLEYRPNPIWGGILTIGFDGRGGSFDEVATGGIEQSLSTTVNYLSVEPALKITPFDFGLHFFAGPTLGFNVAKSFEYKETGLPTQKGDFSSISGTLFGGKIGVGYDLSLTSPDADLQIQLAPFASVNFGQGPRSVEKWSLATLRAGVALKFGTTAEIKKIVEKEIQFSVRAPKIIPVERKVKETFPIRNYVFFDEFSTTIPSRYIQLTKEQADNFQEDHLIEPKPTDLIGRSARQLTVYYNVLNVFGDRMRLMPNTSITLIGSSENGASEGKKLAESIKNYLVDVFGINPNRIEVVGSEKPQIPSVQPGGKRELNLVKPDDRRVEITSNSIELLEPIQIISLQEEPLDSDVIINTSGAEQILSSWMVEVTDGAGATQNFGPFTADQERISGKTILGGKTDGKYKVALVGHTKGGQTIRKEENIRLVRAEKPDEDLGLRFSILFEFDQSKTVATYDRFLTNVVAPLIPEGGSVIIHGHTDVIGEESYNLKLSQSRARDAMQVIERELAKAGKRSVKFDTYGFGEDARRAPFENRFPEERFYNRTVIIDIVPE
ncbi:MAG: OmpA family protein [Bacteroidota bacterium]